MQTIVIIVLLLAGLLCIAAQIAITYLNSRPAKDAPPAASRATATPAPAPAAASATKTAGARSATAKTAAAKAAAKAEAAEAELEAQTADTLADDESTKYRLLRHATLALGSRSAADAKLGMLGLALMLIAVALVVDITVSFTIAT